MIRNIRLSPEFCCSPLWDMDNPGNLSVEDLPLSEGLRERLEAWGKRLDSIFKIDDPASSEWPAPQDEENFYDQGYILWEDLKKELGPEYRVFYLDSLRTKLWAPEGLVINWLSLEVLKNDT
jgi:hypothetical protein